MTNKIYVHVALGIVQDVEGIPDGTEVIIRDFDVEMDETEMEMDVVNGKVCSINTWI